MFNIKSSISILFYPDINSYKSRLVNNFSNSELIISSKPYWNLNDYPIIYNIDIVTC